MGYPRNERGLVDLMVKRIIERVPNAWVLKTQSTGYQRTGVPDLLVSINGRLVAIEAKHRKPGERETRLLERVTPSQWNELRKLKEAGAEAHVLWTVEQLEALLDYVLDL